MSLSKKLKILRLDMWKKHPISFVCHRLIQDYSECSLEHVVPKSLGGTNQPRKLLTATSEQIVEAWKEKHQRTEKELLNTGSAMIKTSFQV